jgi:hypothetical protein
VSSPPPGWFREEATAFPVKQPRLRRSHPGFHIRGWAVYCYRSSKIFGKLLDTDPVRGYNVSMHMKVTTTEPCPDPNLYAVSVWRPDRRTKTGERLHREYTINFATETHALRHVQEVESEHPAGTRVVYRKYWVLKTGYMHPHKGFWEPWNTPYYCSPSSETYYTM